MERLTCRMDHGIIMQTGYDFGIDPDDYDLVQKILGRLAAYEDTGMTPEDVRVLKAENGRLQKENFWLTTGGFSPSVVYCRNCQSQDRCLMEKTFRSEGIEEPFCCRGKVR